MTLKEINRRIQKTDPLVELVRDSAGYHYYVFDAYPIGEKVYETESIMVPYLKQQSAAVWIHDGIEFGRKIREQFL